MTAPCGTPASMSPKNFLFLRKFLTYSSIYRGAPDLLSLKIIPLCQTLSKAWEMSKKREKNFLPFGKKNRLSAVLRFFLKPDCCLQRKPFFVRKRQSRLEMILSKTFPRQVVTLIGRQLEGSELIFFFGIIFTYKTFQTSGISD